MATIQAGARISLQDIEKEVNKSPLKDVRNVPTKYSNKQGITIEGFNFSQTGNQKFNMLQISSCQDITIRRCKFSGTKLLEVALNIIGAKTKNVTVEYCIFENMDTDLSNGGEPMRLGGSMYSGCNYNCTVRKCIFRNLTADPETISIKSAGNIVEDCYFIDNDSMVTVRHSGLATIQFNTFEGENGVRLLGYGNKVNNNLFKDNKADDKMSPIQVQNGIAPKDPNWTDVKTPSGKEGESHANYAQCVDNEIKDNQFINCRNTVYYRKDKSLAPKGLKIDNITAGHNDPEPKPPQPEEEKPPVIVIPPPPPQPEPDPPTEPSENPATHGRLCQLGHDEEAKVRTSIYLCRAHLDDVLPYHQELLNKLRQMYKEGKFPTGSSE